MPPAFRSRLVAIVAATVLLPAPGMVFSQSSSAGISLESGFAHPPEAAKPRVWWHWMSGNVTQEGITADLEWMHRVGIGGMQMFDGDLGVAHYMKPVIFMTPEWQAAMKHAAAEADRLHLEMTMAASGGWSETAGPWVKPAEAMKKAVWSETVVDGPRDFKSQLAAPPKVNGPYQGLEMKEVPMAPDLGGAPATYTPPPKPAPGPDETFYADSKVIAYRLPDNEASEKQQTPKITASDSSFDPAAMKDGDYSTIANLASNPEGTDSWIQWEYPKKLNARAFTLCMGIPVLRGSPLFPNGNFSYSDDGKHWNELVVLPGSPQWGRTFSVRTFSFAPVQARYFRVTMQLPKFSEDQMRRGMRVPRYYGIAEAAVYHSPRISFFEDKASFGTYIATKETTTPSINSDEAVDPSNVVDLTSKMKPDGKLDWQVPEGKWVILRMGYSLTGKKNHPATPEATGYEVDKLSHEHVASYVKQYTGMIGGSVSPYYGKSFRYFLMDSWEAGQENWTENILEEFRKRRGYDPVPYLPALTGRIVGSSEASDSFLWDYRLTLSDLLAENHYKLATQMLAKQGIGLYAEAMGIGMPTTGDGLLNKGQVSVPMGEFWTPLPNDVDTPTREADVREASSAAHIYGKPIAATESFTSIPTIPGWGQTPFYLKQLADQNFARGINRIVFHTSDHQPFVDNKHKPGITLGYYGQHYSRNITWAEQAVAWNSYLARCSFLLQQGMPVEDIAYFYGEGAPVTVPYWKKFSPAVPATSSFDYINSDVLLNQSAIAGKLLALKTGMKYRVLVVPDEMTSLSLPMVKKIAALVKAGGIVVAPRVTASPSLTDHASQDALSKLVAEVWGPAGGLTGSHSYGTGKIYWGSTIQDVFTDQGWQPDFTYEDPQVTSTYDYPVPKADADIVWAHRETSTADIYFVANQKVRTEDVQTTYRVSGRIPEIWHPDTGIYDEADYKVERGRTMVKLHLTPEDSVFVVFRAKAQPHAKPATTSTKLATLDQAWKLTFPPDLGAPAQIDQPALQSWTESTETGVKYFSGTATYAQDFDVDPQWLAANPQIELDLGRVREIAEVSVNGKSVGGILWKPPFTADIKPALRPGKNHLEIKVTNLWPNRIIGDLQPDAAQKYTFVVYKPYKADSPLTESGLMGPVELSGVKLRASANPN